MALWFMRFRTFVRIALTLLSAVGPLLGFLMTYIILHDWIQIRQGDVYYVEHNYLGDAAWWGLPSLGSLLAAGRVLFIREARVRWLWLPMAMLFIMIIFPNQLRLHDPIIPNPNRAQRVDHFVRSPLLSLYSDLKTAVERGETPQCISGPTSMVSPYFRAGVQLPFQRVCVTTDLPFDSLLASGAPGTIYVVTRPGDPTIRLRATVLGTNVATTAQWLRPLSDTGPMELTISPQPTPRSSPPVQGAATPMSSDAAPNARPPERLPHANH